MVRKIKKFRKIIDHLKKPLLVGILIILLLSSFVVDYKSILGATYAWLQSSWAGGADTITTASHATNQNNWTKYYSASTTISAGTGITLSGTASSTTETTDADFNAGDKTDYIYVGSDTVYPQKPNTYACESNNDNICQSARCDTTCQAKLADGSACDEASDCSSGTCCGDGTCSIGGVCPCSASTTCEDSCSYGGLTYGTVTANSQCWLDRNLGATAVATAYNSPTTSYGWYFQWGRLLDGHQISNSGTQTGLSSSDNPGHANFIYGMGSPYDWRSPQNGNLWGSAGGYLNNPCPTGWHVPSQPEWASVVSALGITNYTTAASSVLHLPAAGGRSYSSATLGGQGSYGGYWSATPDSTFAYYLYFSSSGVGPAYNSYRASGFSVRCVKN
ncbi:fibrobacter succinogenes major paralogous domain-containing protein [Patescibacteria group bacterium]|nr:fibrobacter succinogenes major paralogous domain-containing protein [Patescibacteria group bacterium]